MTILDCLTLEFRDIRHAGPDLQHRAEKCMLKNQDAMVAALHSSEFVVGGSAVVAGRTWCGEKMCNAISSVVLLTCPVAYPNTRRCE